mmetsp:Transcript_15515/g.39614  ORF Transcript_15515/g.39614 Transcript_15515/m.39614 type:complete len:538 (-) Transcript_15515:59-1672(-)
MLSGAQEACSAMLARRWVQIPLLILCVMACGVFLSIERRLLPTMALDVYCQQSYVAMLTFLVVFGLSKAAANLFSGSVYDMIGRKIPLIFGSVLLIPCPLVLLFSDSWSFVLVTNVMFGVAQGIVNSACLVMLIDWFGAKHRGMAAGIFECAAYGTVSVSTFIVGALYQASGYRPLPMAFGVLFSLIGLVASFFVLDTSRLVIAEAEGSQPESFATQPPQLQTMHEEDRAHTPSEFAAATTLRERVIAVAHSIATYFRQLATVLWRCFKSRMILAAIVAGVCVNIKDGLIWGLAPLFFPSYSPGDNDPTTVLIALYTAAWGVCQLFTGILSDYINRKYLVTVGVYMQGFSLFLIAVVPVIVPSYSVRFGLWIVFMLTLGLGTALMYPVVQALVADECDPQWRASGIGIYRACRDAGYAVGAALSGVLADAFGLLASFMVIALLLLLSGLFFIAYGRSREELGQAATTDDGVMFTPLTTFSESASSSSAEWRSKNNNKHGGDDEDEDTDTDERQGDDLEQTNYREHHGEQLAYEDIEL